MSDSARPAAVDPVPPADVQARVEAIRQYLESGAWGPENHWAGCFTYHWSCGVRELLKALDAAAVERQALGQDCASECACGCPVADHDNYGEDGEQCDHQEHECYRTSKVALAELTKLRLLLLAAETQLTKAQARAEGFRQDLNGLNIDYGKLFSEFNVLNGLLHAVEQQHQWQDIATAPKDGRMILVYPSSTWTDDTELDYEVTYWDDQASYVGGQFVGAWHQFRHPDDYTGPTHWRPLPSPPVPSES